MLITNNYYQRITNDITLARKILEHFSLGGRILELKTESEIQEDMGPAEFEECIYDLGFAALSPVISEQGEVKWQVHKYISYGASMYEPPGIDINTYKEPFPYISEALTACFGLLIDDFAQNIQESLEDFWDDDDPFQDF